MVGAGPSDDGETGWIHCRTLDNINRRDKDCSSDGSETERLVRRTDVRVLGLTKDKGDRVPQSSGESQWHQSHLDPPTSAKSYAGRQKEREVESGNKGEEEIGIRRTLNHDIDCVCQRVFEIGRIRTTRGETEECGKKKRHYHYPPYPTMPACHHR